jgi:hypothetical protein
MNPKKIIYTLFVIVVIAAAIFYGYQFFGSRGDGAEEGRARLETLGLAPENTQEAVSEEFLQLLLSLQKIDLSGDLFLNPIFAGLVDFSTELQPQTPGRVNPFAPIGSVGSVSPSPAGGGESSAGGEASNDLRDELLRTLNP